LFCTLAELAVEFLEKAPPAALAGKVGGEPAIGRRI
jgi:hypothetical protein